MAFRRPAPTWSVPSRNARIEAAPEPLPQPVYAPGTDLPDGQKHAIIKLRGGELAGKILDHLREMSAPEPAKGDWAALISARLIVRQFDKSPAGRLTLTPPGIAAATGIMRDWAQKFGIHHMVRTGQGRSYGMRCTCGHSVHLRYGSNPEGAVMGAMEQHRKHVESGTWQPLETVFARLDAQFGLSPEAH